MIGYAYLGGHVLWCRMFLQHKLDPIGEALPMEF